MSSAAPTPARGEHGLGLLPGGSLDLTPTPDHVVLGRDSRVVLDLQARAPDGTPLVVVEGTTMAILLRYPSWSVMEPQGDLVVPPSMVT